jgi:hypothetical protein
VARPDAWRPAKPGGARLDGPATHSRLRLQLKSTNSFCRQLPLLQRLLYKLHIDDVVVGDRFSKRSRLGNYVHIKRVALPIRAPNVVGVDRSSVAFTPAAESVGNALRVIASIAPRSLAAWPMMIWWLVNNGLPVGPATLETLPYPLGALFFGIIARGLKLWTDLPPLVDGI